MMKKLSLFLTAAALIACICFGAVACKKKPSQEKASFDAPTEVRAEGDELLWNAVEGAADYTVKINADETTTTSENSLDLTSVVTKLTRGENTLSVKVNATEAKNESAYSQTVTYVYSPVTQLSAPVNLKIEGDTLTWDAVEGAANGYTVKIGTQTVAASSNSLDLAAEEVKAVLVKGENKISVKANKVSGLAESAYSSEITYNYVIAADEEAAQFKHAVEAIGTVTADSEAAISNAKAKYKVLSEEAKAVEGVSEASALLIQKDGEYFALLVNAVDTQSLDTDLTVSDNQAADAAIAKAEEYYATLLDNAGSAEAKATLDEKKAAYDEVLASVGTLLTELEESIAQLNLDGNITQDKLTVDYYKQLKQLKNGIDELGEYAAGIWQNNNAPLTAAVEKEIENLLKTPAEIIDEVEIFFDAVNGKVTVLCKAVNILGDTIAENAPALSLTTYAADTITHQAAFTGKDGVYHYTTNNIVVEEAKGSTEDADDYQLKIVYSIGGGSEKTVIYKKINNDIYFDPAKDFNAIVDDTVHFSGAPGFEAYFDIYESGNIALGKGETIPAITGFPLIKQVPVKNDMTVEAFRAQLAREYSDLLLDKEYEVRFVLYLTEKNEDGAIKISNVKNDLVSHDVYMLDLTEEDKKERLFMGGGGEGVWGSSTSDPGLYEFGARISMADLKKQLFGTADGIADADVCKELDYVVSITLDGVTKEFTTDFTGGGISGKIIKRYVYNLFKQEEATAYKISVRFALKEGSSYSDRFKDSNPIPARDWNFTATLADTQLNIAGALNGGKWSLGDKTTNTNHTWEVSTPNTSQHPSADLHDGVNIYAYIVGEKDVQTYDFFANDEPLATYKHNKFAWAQWKDIDEAIVQSLLKFSGEDRPTDATLVFVMQWIANDKAISLGYSDSVGIYATDADGNRDTKTYSWDWSVPNESQIRFNGGRDFFEFFRTSGGAGSIFKNGVVCIELMFTNGTDSYSAYMFKSEDAGVEPNSFNVYMYTNKDKDVEEGKNKLGCGSHINGYVAVADFNGWVMANYGLDGFNASSGDWSFSTKVHHDGSFYIGEGSYSEAIN